MFQKEFSFQEFGFSSKIIRDLITNQEVVKPFIGDFFSLDAIANQARKKDFTDVQRKTLVSALSDQNASFTLTDKSKKNIAALADSSTVTITTGHQLNLLTGPLYSIYKVAQVISLSQAMNQRDSDFHYVPVFWMATEDHDFDEINHINLFGNKIAWEKEGQENYIVGAVKPNGVNAFTNQILEKYQDEGMREHLNQFLNAYTHGENLAEATRTVINQLFGSYGLVIIDGNDLSLKQGFMEVARKEIEQEFTYKAVTESNKKLDTLGYHNQVFVRNCNLFYIHGDNKRERISKEGDSFSIGDSKFTTKELIEILEKNPAAFSPNALLRPVYQESILPNTAYIGGGGEIAYWLQIKGVFDGLGLEFPLLRVRDSLILLKDKELKDLEALELDIPELKRDLHDLVKEIALKNREIELNEEKGALQELKEKLLDKAISIDKGAAGMIEAEFAKMRSSFDRIESKLIKAEKSKYEQTSNKIKKFQNKIYPNGGFQERFENFLPYFLTNPDFISKIVDNLIAQDEPMIKVIIV